MTQDKNHDDVVDDSADEMPDRVSGQYYPWLLGFLLYLVAPFFLGTFLEPGQATIAVLALLGCGSFALGFLDGIVFRFSPFFAFGSSVLFWVATVLYFNPGSWLYMVPTFLLVLGGSFTGQKVVGRPRRSDSDQE